MGLPLPLAGEGWGEGAIDFEIGSSVFEALAFVQGWSGVGAAPGASGSELRYQNAGVLEIVFRRGTLTLYEAPTRRPLVGRRGNPASSERTMPAWSSILARAPVASTVPR
jgi:hypothetical protein